MTKQQFIKLIGNVDDDLIENYLGSPVDESRPTKVYAAKSGASFGKWAAFAAAAVCVVAIVVFFAANRRVPVDPVSPDDPGGNTSVFSEISDSSSDDTSSTSIDSATSSSDPSGSDPESISPSSDTEFSENEKIEAMIQKYQEGGSHETPYWKPDETSGMRLYFPDGTTAHVPLPNTSPGITPPYDISLRNDAVVIAYFSGNPNSISILSTTDQGKSWQSSELNLKNAEKYDEYHIFFQNTEEGFLFLSKPLDLDYVIYTTEDTGKTWKPAGSLSNGYTIGSANAAGGFLWIAGDKDKMSRPVILKSDDLVNWREVQLSIDTTKYPDGYCSNVYFSGETGLALVYGIAANNDRAWMWFSSEDYGETWSFYKTISVWIDNLL